MIRSQPVMWLNSRAVKSPCDECAADKARGGCIGPTEHLLCNTNGGRRKHGMMSSVVGAALDERTGKAMVCVYPS